MTCATGSPQTTSLSWSSVVTCATTPSFNLSSTVFLLLILDLGSPERNTTRRPAQLNVLGGVFHTGPLLLEDLEDPDDLLEDVLLDFVDNSDDLDGLSRLLLPLSVPVLFECVKLGTESLLLLLLLVLELVIGAGDA